MKRHGLTLVELLAALTLLGMFTGALVSWTVGAAQRRLATESSSRWQFASAAALDAIKIDLTQQDLPSQSDPVQVEGGDRLLIQTRDHGPAWATYFLDQGVLLRAIADDARTAKTVRMHDAASRVLVGEVSEWTASLTPLDPTDPNGPKVLRVRLVNRDGNALERVFLMGGAR